MLTASNKQSDQTMNPLHWSHSCSQSTLSTIYQGRAECSPLPVLLCIFLVYLTHFKTSLNFFLNKSLTCASVHRSVSCVCLLQLEHVAPLCSSTLVQTRESVDYWMQLQRRGQTIKIDSGFAFYHSLKVAEVKACEPRAADILIMSENMPPDWGGMLIKKRTAQSKTKGVFSSSSCSFY